MKTCSTTCQLRTCASELFILEDESWEKVHVSKMAKYRLHYFELRGRGECSRMLFTLNGQDFDDVRHKFENWVEEKKLLGEWWILTSTCCNDDTFNGSSQYNITTSCIFLIDPPNGQLPFLEIDDDVICQSRAIERMLAKKFGAQNIEYGAWTETSRWA